MFEEMLVGAEKMDRSKSCGAKKTAVVDRISNLPDSVLAHILSFVSTEEAIHTCILSKRWKSVWASIPVIEFHFGKFLRDRRILKGTEKECMNKFKEYEVKYVQFAKGIMLNREALLLDKFKLHWFNGSMDFYYATKSVIELIPHALKFKPRVLSVKFRLNNCNYSNIDSIFTCASLEDVLLNYNYDLDKFAPNSINLPCLKKLELKVLYIGNDFLNKLFLGCPVLEELSLCYCRLYIDRIDSNTLKKLTIRDCYQGEEVQKLEIFTPGLLYLEITKCMMKNVSVRNMPSIVNVRMDFGWYDDYDSSTGSEINFLSCLSNATSLNVTFVECNIKEMLKNATCNCPTFNNLKSLSIVWRRNYDFDWIVFFLHNSPNLQNMTLLDNIVWSNKSPNLGLEEPKDNLSPWRDLKMVRIVNCKTWKINSITLDLLVKKLCAHVRTIGKIIIDN